MKIWIENKTGPLTGYCTEPFSDYIEVSLDPSDAEEMQGGLLDFHNYSFDGKKLTRNTDNEFQHQLEYEATKPPEPTKEELEARLAKLEELLSDLL